MDSHMKVLVTGSNGLVGSALKKILGDEHVYHVRKDVDLFDAKKTKDYFEEASIGRVVVKPTYRDKKLGHILMREAIYFMKHQLGETKITISAQLYLKKFYESHGFIQTSEMYLEDDIPHIEMRRS